MSNNKTTTLSENAQSLAKQVAQKHGHTMQTAPQSTEEDAPKEKTKKSPKEKLSIKAMFGRLSSKNKRPKKKKTIEGSKKRLQSKFSRRRFMRDYNGNRLVPLLAFGFFIIGLNISIIIANTIFFIPQTEANLNTQKEANAFIKQIESTTPKLADLIKRRETINDKVENMLTQFPATKDVRGHFADFINDLDQDPRIEVSEQNIEANKSEMPSIDYVVASFRAKTTFLLWLKYRNEMLREVNEVNIIEESIKAPPDDSAVDIFVQMARPGRSP